MRTRKFPDAWKLNKYFYITHTSEAASHENTLNDTEMEMRPGKVCKMQLKPH